MADDDVSSTRDIIEAEGQLITYHAFADDTTYQDYAVIFPDASIRYGFAALIKDQDIVEGKGIALMPGDMQTQPAIRDTITQADGTVFSIASSNPLAPAGQVILNTMFVDK